MNGILSELAKVLEQRKSAAADSSYVASLYAKGLNKILEKVGEEANETILAAKDYQGPYRGKKSSDFRDCRSVVSHPGNAQLSGFTSLNKCWRNWKNALTCQVLSRRLLAKTSLLRPSPYRPRVSEVYNGCRWYRYLAIADHFIDRIHAIRNQKTS
jgi:hypothetical protein